MIQAARQTVVVVEDGRGGQSRAGGGHGGQGLDEGGHGGQGLEGVAVLRENAAAADTDSGMVGGEGDVGVCGS